MLGDFSATESREADEIRGGGRLDVLSQMASLVPWGLSTLSLYSIFSEINCFALYQGLQPEPMCVCVCVSVCARALACACPCMYACTWVCVCPCSCNILNVIMLVLLAK